MPKRNITEVEVAGRRVLMRVDFNVPIADGQITSDRRIRLALDSVRSVVDRGGRLLLMSHLGRPKGKGPEPDKSLRPCAECLGELLDRQVAFVEQCDGSAVTAAVERLADGDVLLLENLRFHPGEKSGDIPFAESLAALGDVYCNEAFGTCARKDASMFGAPSAMAGRPRVAGLLLERELQYLSETIERPERPFVAILGGAKVSDKIGAINHLLDRVDAILIGGAMAYTFMAARGQPVGDSLVEEDRIETARSMLAASETSRADLVLPVDHVCGRALASDTDTQVTGPDIEDGWLGLDIGPRSVEQFAGHLGGAKTVVWNGPVGACEIEPFDRGTKAVAEAIVAATEGNGATSIIGGGDSAAAIEHLGLAERVSHVSTGGGASLAMLAGERFASVDLLDEK